MHINAGQIPVITEGTKDTFTYLKYAVIRGFEHQYTARAPIVCTSVIIELKDNYLLQSRPMITG